MAVLPTGFGKSLPYQLYLPVARQLKQLAGDSHSETEDVFDEKVIVCCPLISLMQDQVQQMKKKGMRVGFKGDSAETDKMIEDGEIDLIYASPETLVGDPIWRSSLRRLNVKVIVVDEFHTIATWGEDEDHQKAAFRKWFSYIGELRSLFPQASVLALSATCTKKIRKRVVKVLSMKEDYTEVVLSPNKSNIKLIVSKVHKDLEIALCFLVDGLNELKDTFPRTIIYCTSIKDTCNIFTYLATELPVLHDLFDMYHSETPDEQKNAILHSLKDGQSKLRIIIATSALGMGIDVVNCHSVLLFGLPKDIVDLIQEIGRVGRDGQSAVAILLYNQYHMLKISKDVKSILKTTKCRRISLMESFLTDKQIEQLKSEIGVHTCCDLCGIACLCGTCEITIMEQLLKKSTVSETSTSSSSPECDTDYDGTEDEMN
ncbi:hypothetical protein SNE40_022132 [Patella caerulea]|uniref:DNA 3'-5' helicase n=1 Tax=Patella caerulea TaxID=87958 RepID=A0AAN8G5T1_PATCE